MEISTQIFFFFFFLLLHTMPPTINIDSTNQTTNFGTRSTTPVHSEVEYVREPSESLCCPVCHDVFTDPLITTRCYHSFCASCIYQSLEVDGICPLCRGEISPEELHPNLALAQLISELLVYCTYRSNGCSQTIRLDTLNSHRQGCSFCPTTCSNAKIGCPFTGTTGQLADHIRTCAFEQLKSYIEANNVRIERLESLVVSQQREMARLVSEVKWAQRRSDTSVSLDPNGHTDPGESSENEYDSITEGKGYPHGDIGCSRTIAKHNCGVTSLAYSRGFIYAGGHDGGVKIFDAETGNDVYTLNGHQMSVWALAMHEPLSRLFTAGSDGAIKVWNLADWLNNNESEDTRVGDGPVETASILSHTGKVYSLVVVGDRLYSASSDRTVKVYDVHNLSVVSTFTGHQDGVNSVLGIPDGHIATAASDKTIKIWDASTGQILHTTPPHTSEVLDLAQGDRMLFASTYDAIIHCYDLRSSSPHVAPLTTLSGHSWEVWQLEYDSGELFSASFDHTVRRWDLRGFVDGGRGGSRSLGGCTGVLKGHKGFVHAMTLGKNQLITGCADRTIKIWQ